MIKSAFFIWVLLFRWGKIWKKNYMGKGSFFISLVPKLSSMDH